MTEPAALYQVTPRHGCWRDSALPHPWHQERIRSVACGFDERLVHAKCRGCHRARAESPRMQLDALGKLGDVAQLQTEHLEAV